MKLFGWNLYGLETDALKIRLNRQRMTFLAIKSSFFNNLMLFPHNCFSVINFSVPRSKYSSKYQKIKKLFNRQKNGLLLFHQINYEWWIWSRNVQKISCPTSGLALLNLFEMFFFSFALIVVPGSLALWILNDGCVNFLHNLKYELCLMS